MAASSQISQNKGGRNEPDANRSNSVRLMHEALLEMIDNTDTINSNPEEINSAIHFEDESLNGVTKSMEDEVGLKGQADDVECVDGDEKAGSINQITDWNPEATLASETGDMDSEAHLTYYEEGLSPMNCSKNKLLLLLI
jgi:hypothetical protein